jgi:hypothetical protein
MQALERARMALSVWRIERKLAIDAFLGTLMLLSIADSFEKAFQFQLSACLEVPEKMPTKNRHRYQLQIESR